VNKVAAIAWVAVREAVRQKLAVNLLVFALALLAASITISSLTFGEQYRIIVDLGLSAMEIFGTLIAVFLGAGLVAREVERKSLYPVLAKPTSRAQYVAGRYLGLVVTSTGNLIVMATVFAIVLATYLRGFGFVRDTPFFAVIASLALRFAMIAAIATLFSCFTTTTLAAIFTLSCVVAGHLSSDLVRYWSRQGTIGSALGKVAYLVVPNFEALNFKEAMVYKEPLSAAAVTAFAYGVLYAGAVLLLAIAIFARRDLR
jgi:ABC-type transport system involved in multi-copper enzyme maturation permease subunit